MFIFLLATVNPPLVEARVKGGTCADCHTMHNSQGNSPMAYTGTVGNQAGWNASDQLRGGTSTASQGGLLISDCVGCHTSSTTDTIITLGSLKIPIVYNTQTPTNPLAGGNFYWVTTLGDAYGHNVYGISGADGDLTEAPGPLAGCGTPNNCHKSLATETVTKDLVNYLDGGCQGCHTPKHHAKATPANGQENADSGWYRFLDGTSVHPGWTFPIAGKEDADWEQTNSASDHNVYFAGSGDVYDIGAGPLWGVSKFCAGCHYNFHAQGIDDPNGSGAVDDPWLRHPSEKLIPSTGEFSQLSNQPYNPTIPVGKQDLAGAVPSVVTTGTGGDKVMCVSCHRAHGSPYPAMLRWNYSADVNMKSHSAADNSNDDGCFYCHRQKDDL